MTAVYLAHHGVKGQKWGVRRYQKLDSVIDDYINVRMGNTTKDDFNKKHKGVYKVG